MVISHYGLGMVKITQGDLTIAFNPIGEAPSLASDGAGTGVKPVKFGADLALVSLNDPSFNGIENVSRGERVPFVVNGPGEYELGGVFIQGVMAPGPAGQINTAYTLVLDGLRLAHLGAWPAEQKVPETVREVLGEIDILFLPAEARAVDLEAKIVVPVNFEPATLKTFLKEWGAEGRTAVDSLNVKRKDLADKQAEVVVIKSF